MRRARIYAGFIFLFGLTLPIGARRSEGAPPAEKTAPKPAAGKAPDVTGQYQLGKGERFSVLQAEDELWFLYEGSPQDCWCVAQGKRKPYDIWYVTGDLEGVLDFPRGRPSFKPVLYQPPCCAEPNWGGMEPASKKKPAPPKQCVVTADKAPFFDLERKQTKTYLIKGDHIDVVGEASNDEKVLGRFVGKKKTTIGLLWHYHLDCGGKD
jgi:hypothetical protein